MSSRKQDVHMKQIIGRKTSMSPPAYLMQIREEESREYILKNIEEIISAASSIDALKIFYAAKDGIESSTQTIKKLNLTQKRYYTNLKRLIDSGLIEKEDGRYTHTTLGKIFYSLIEVLRNAVEHEDKLGLIDRILKVKNLSAEEAEEIIGVMLRDVDLIPTGYLADLFGSIKIMDKWEKAVQEAIWHINKSKREILFACKHYDIRLIEACLAAAQRKVKVYCLLDKELKISRLSQSFLNFLFTGNGMPKDLSNILRSSLFEIKYANLPHSFLIIDEEYSLIEVLTPINGKYSFVLVFHNKRLSKNLSGTFNELWKNGESKQ